MDISASLGEGGKEKTCSNRNKVVAFGQTFLNLEDEEFYKYLEIAKKTLSGTLGNNLLEFEFPGEEDIIKPF